MSPGPINWPPTLTPAKAFFLLFDADIIHYLVQETQLYAMKETGDKELNWQMTEKMLWSYLAIFLAMCLRPAPSLTDYW